VTEEVPLADESALAHEAAVAAALDGPALDGPDAAPESQRTSRVAVVAFILAIVLLAMIAATTSGADPSSWLAPADGCGGG
jgi:hypothetical protein